MGEVYSCASGGVIAGGRTQGYVPRDLVPNGVWTWFTDPRAVYRNNATYIGWHNNLGDCGVSKFDHSNNSVSSFVLGRPNIADDHNNVAVSFTPSGRVVCHYSAHNDDSFRMRVSTSPEDISSFSAESARGFGGTYSYSNPIVLSQMPGREWLFYRSGPGGSATNFSYRTTDDNLVNWSAEISVWFNGGSTTPYNKIVSNGVNRIDFVSTTQHPVQGQVSIYHYYMQLDGSNAVHWYKSDGTEIATALPHGPSAASLVYDGSAVRGWVWDITIDASGKPRILGTRYPANNGSDIRYMCWRWTGAAWMQSEICADGAGLYSPEVYYAGGLCFDAINADIVYLSAPVSGVRQIQEWRSSDSGASWSKHRDITTGGTEIHARPYSPRNHDGRLRVLWWTGIYNTFNDYNTSIKGM